MKIICLKNHPSGKLDNFEENRVFKRNLQMKSFHKDLLVDLNACPFYLMEEIIEIDRRIIDIVKIKLWRIKNAYPFKVSIIHI